MEGTLAADLGKRGSTLVEVAIVTVIVGFAGVALMEFVTSATRANATLSDRAIALNIARAGQEWAASKSLEELLVFFGNKSEVKSPKLLSASDLPLVDGTAPRDAVYRNWTQTFALQPISTEDPTQPAATAGPLLQITVKVSKGAVAQCSLSRIYADAK